MVQSPRCAAASSRWTVTSLWTSGCRRQPCRVPGASRHRVPHSLTPAPKGSQPGLTEQQRREVRRLSHNFPLVWHHPETPTELQEQLLRALSSRWSFVTTVARSPFDSLGRQRVYEPERSAAGHAGRVEGGHFCDRARRKAGRALDDGESACILNMKKAPHACAGPTIA